MLSDGQRANVGRLDLRLGEGSQAIGSTSSGKRAAFCLLALAFTGLLALLGLGADAPRAQGSDKGTSVVSVAEAVDRRCYSRELEGAAGVDSVTTAGPPLSGASFGVVDARLEGPAGSDWDLVVFDSAGEVVAASTSSGASEVASGYVLDPTELTVQACRISGEGEGAQLTVETDAVEQGEVEKVSLATVKTPTRQDKDTLGTLGLDPAEGAGKDWVKVVLYGPDDREALERAGLRYEIDVANLGRQSVRDRTAERSYARQTTRSSLPSGRDTYRRYFHYTQEMKDLAKQNPNLVRPITLKHKTWEGRTVEGIEITTDVDNVRDGKPVFLHMGVHHAREWPAGEHTLESAYQLIKGYKSGNQRIAPLVERTRTIVIPIINPDGFNASREAGQQQGAADGRGGDDIVNFAMSPNEYRRKNCRFADDSEGGNCAQPSVGLAEFGVDPNRNYGGFWGGPGASPSPQAQTYHGPKPFSEPETQNVRELIAARQVTTLITNHTFSNLVLRPPGAAAQGNSVDEPAYKALGDAMAAENGYLSQHGYELYDTHGTTEDWSYYATGGLGFTFEIGCNRVDPEEPDPANKDCIGNFHPPFEEVVAEWEGTSPDAQAVGGEGNSEAYLIMQEATANPQMHSVLEGKAPAGAILKIEKTFQTPTAVEDPASFEDHLETAMKVPDSGNFDWHTNPSTRPLVAQARGRVAAGPPPEISGASFSGSGATTVPAVGCADFETEDPNCWNDHAFEIPTTPGTDVDSIVVEAQWGTPASDWDFKVFIDTNGDGTSVGEPDSAQVGQSAQGLTTEEASTIVSPETADGQLQRGKYVVRMINWAGGEPYTGSITAEGPETYVPPKTETWRFTCTYNGETRVTQDILINRGERKTLDLAACATGKRAGKRAGRCLGRKATLVGTRKNDKIIGTKKRDVIVARGGKDKIRSRGGNDLICAKGGKDRIAGGSGEDKVKAGGGPDRAGGGTGNDKLKGGAGADKLSGQGGKDTLRGNGGRDKLRGGGGKDRCVAHGRDIARGCER